MLQRQLPPPFVSASRTRRLRHYGFLKYLPLIVALLVPALISIRYLDDPDLWWHLKDGERIVTERAIPSTDEYSFTAQGAPWVNSYVISQSGMYLVYKHFAAAGLEIATALIVCLAFVFAFSAFKPKSGLAYTLFFSGFILIAAMIGFERYVPRPSIMTTLFVALYFLILERSGTRTDVRGLRSNEPRTTFSSRYATPLMLAGLMVIWVNTHTGFVAGCAIISFYLSSSIIKVLWMYVSGKRYSSHDGMKSAIERSWMLVMALTITTAATLVNPYGAGIYTPHMEVALYPEYRNTIIEWRPLFSAPRSSLLIFFYFKVCVTLLGISFLLNIRRIKLDHVLISIALLLMAISSRRHVDIFAIIACPIFAYNAGGFFGRLRPREWYARVRPAVILGIAIIGASAYLGYYVASGTLYYNERLTHIFGFGEHPKVAADELVSFFDENDLEARVYNSYTLGGYLLFKWHPDRQIFIDGRIFPYGPEFLAKYDRSTIDPEVFDRIVSKWDITAAMLTFFPYDTMSLIKRLAGNNEWAMVFFNENGVIFLKKDAYPRETISRLTVEPRSAPTVYAESKPPFYMGFRGKPYLVPALNLSVFYFNVGAREKSYEVLMKGLSRDPDNPLLRNALGSFFMKIGKPDIAVKELEHVLKRWPKFHEAYINLATAQLRTGNLEEAKRALELALGTFPSSTKALMMYGKLEYSQKDYLSAIEYFDRAMELDPENATGSYWHALTISKLRPDLAADAWKRHLKLLIKIGGRPSDIKAAQLEAGHNVP